MATDRGLARFVFIGMWVAFVVAIFMYWHAVSSSGELIVIVSELNGRIAEVNATIDELQNELRGIFGGCIPQNEALKTEKKTYVDALPNRDKTIKEKTEAAAKAAEKQKEAALAHTQANATYFEWATKLDGCSKKCNDSMVAVCDPTKKALGKSFLEKLFQRS